MEARDRQTLITVADQLTASTVEISNSGAISASEICNKEMLFGRGAAVSP